MENFKRNMKYQFMETKKFLLGFFITIIIIDLVFYILNARYSENINIGFSLGELGVNSALSVVGINIMAILIALIAYNFESNYEDFPLAISLSMTRKGYFLSFLADNIFIALIFAVIQGILFKIEPIIMRMIDRVPLYDFVYFNNQTDNIFYIIFILFILFLGFTAFWNLLASINYKVGYKMWIVLIAANILLTSISFRIGFIETIFDSIEKILSPRLGVFQILIILASIGILYTLNYLIVIRTDIKKKSLK